MSLFLDRYKEIRTRLIYLHRIIAYRLYTVYVTPAMRMTVEQIRDRTEYTQEGFVGDHNYYNEYQPIQLDMASIIDILPNLVNERDLGFLDAHKSVVNIYETIQEYLQLWVELRSKAPEFRIPTINELRNLECLSYSIFPTYKKIKGYLNNSLYINKPPSTEEEAANYAMMTLESLFGMSAIGRTKDNRIDFVSHLNHIDGGDELSNAPDVLSRLAISDSISNEDVHNLGSWSFGG